MTADSQIRHVDRFERVILVVRYVRPLLFLLGGGKEEEDAAGFQARQQRQQHPAHHRPHTTLRNNIIRVEKFCYCNLLREPVYIADQQNYHAVDPICDIKHSLKVVILNPKKTMAESNGSTSSIPDSGWSKDRLMGKSVSFKGVSQNGEASTRPSSSSSKEKIDPMLWGRPGHLTDEEAETFVSYSFSSD
jgi:hypothetical protein